MCEYSIEIRGLCKSFGSQTAVDQLNLSIKKGELFAFLGVNGAGKTTTLRMMNGLSKPSAGTATILGHDLITELEAIKKAGNLSPQETAVAPNLTVQENLFFIAGIYGISKECSNQKADELKKRLNLDAVWHKKAKTLSGGYQRKLSIAMALITEPQILYLDEPTLGLDVLARRDLWRVIEGLRNKVTIVLTTHYMEEAEKLADRIGIMKEGKLIALGSMDDLKKATGKNNLEDIFVNIVEEAQ